MMSARRSSRNDADVDGSDISLYHCLDARSFRCLWLLEEMNARNYTLVTMPFPPRYTHKSYLRTNILGTVPYLQCDNEVAMTESVGICLYLCSKYAPDSNLCVAKHEGAEYAAFLNWLFQADATLTFPQTIVLRYTLMEPGKADAAAEDYAQWYLARLRLLDRHLSDDREFLCAGRFTIADICIAYSLFLGTTLRRGNGRYLSDDYKPQTMAYLERMMRRRGWIAAKASQLSSSRHFRKTKRGWARL